MPSFAKVMLCGNLTADPEMKYTASGMAITKFSLAVNRREKKDGEWDNAVSFFNVTTFGKRAESCAEYCKKGKAVVVDGELIQRRWEDKDGNKRNGVEINASMVHFLWSDGGKVADKEDNEEVTEEKEKEKEEDPYGNIPF